MNCFGNEFESGCGVYSGPAIPGLDITTGDPLDEVLEKIATASASSETAPSSSISSDDVMSKSLIRNGGSVCASKVVVRDFTYTLTNTASSTTFSWNLLTLIQSLPADYEVGSVRVQAVGRPNSAGSNLIASSKSPSAGFNIGLDRYPVSVDITLRVAAPCGNIEMNKTIYLSSGVDTGTKRAVLTAEDLSTAGESDVTLTDQLNNLEATVNFLGVKVDSMDKVDVSGAEMDIKTAVISQQGEIDEINSKLSAPNDFEIDYINNSNQTGSLSDIITNLYAEIQALKVENASLTIETQSLRNTVNALNASS